MSRGASLKKVCMRRLFLTVILPREVTGDLKLYGNSIFCAFSPLLSAEETQTTCCRDSTRWLESFRGDCLLHGYKMLCLVFSEDFTLSYSTSL